MPRLRSIWRESRVTTTFYSRFEKALRKSATAAGAGPSAGLDRRHPRRRREPRDQPGPRKLHTSCSDRATCSVSAAGAITRRFPTPNTSDAEVTKVALVEFAAHDLPWRYTPQLAGGGGLRPWLVLVVGQRAPERHRAASRRPRDARS